MPRFAIHLLCGFLLGEIAAAERLPVETFFRRPSFSRLSLSPDGKHVAAIYCANNHSFLHLTDLDTGKRRLIQGEDIWGFKWLSAKRLLYYTGGLSLGGTIAINADGTEKVTLVKPFINQAGLRVAYATVIEVLAVEPRSTNDLLVASAELHLTVSGQARPDVRRLNSHTGKSTLEEKNPGNVLAWLAGADGVVRVAAARDKDDIKILYRPSKERPWKVVHQSKREDNDLMPLTLSADGKYLNVAAHNGHDTIGLYQFDLETQELAKCLWTDEQFDLQRALWSQKAHLLGVFYETEELQFKPLNPELEKWQTDINEALPGRVNTPVTWSQGGKKLLYLSKSDRDPGSYYVVDTTKREFGIFARTYASINPQQMAGMRPIQYKARDGLVIHGYLTLPLEGAGTNLPLIVVPHGGPWVRDSWHFDPMVQFLANRGYAVIQMNFRGSTGYGLKFLRAGFKEWGGKMQDDITDGVEWAISQGIADRNRVAIFGASYGGYAALMGLITTPELYKCAISYAGVTDVNAYVRGMRFKGELGADVEGVWRERIGDYRSDQKHLDAISPVHLVEKIQAPILLAYGGRDPKVKVEEGRDLANALKKKKKKFELIIEPDEGHGFYSEKALTNLFNHVEAFLKENL